MANAIHAGMFGIDKNFVVTSWFRNDYSFHRDGYAFDIRIRDVANIGDVVDFWMRLTDAGIPAFPFGINAHTLEREPGQHLHVGDIATRMTEGR